MCFYGLYLAHAQQLKQLLHKPPLGEGCILNITINIWIIKTFGIGLIHTDVELVTQAFINQGDHHYSQYKCGSWKVVIEIPNTNSRIAWNLSAWKEMMWEQNSWLFAMILVVFTQIPSLDLNFSKFVIYEIFILFLIIFVLELKYCGFYNVS